MTFAGATAREGVAARSWADRMVATVVRGSADVHERMRGDRIVTGEAPANAAMGERVRIDRIVTAVAAGALLGALAAMPYDQLLGISDPACAILRSVLTTAVWAGLRSQQPRDLNFSAAAPAVDALGKRAPQ
jgi:hypothetical protein